MNQAANYAAYYDDYSGHSAYSYSPIVSVADCIARPRLECPQPASRADPTFFLPEATPNTTTYSNRLCFSWHHSLCCTFLAWPPLCWRGFCRFNHRGDISDAPNMTGVYGCDKSYSACSARRPMERDFQAFSRRRLSAEKRRDCIRRVRFCRSASLSKCASIGISFNALFYRADALCRDYIASRRPDQRHRF